jgi:hypothetical protein
MNDEIVLEFSGCCRIEAKNAKFVYTGEDENVQFNISGEEYRQLTMEQKADYVPDDIIALIRDSSDVQWSGINVVQE